MAARLIAVRSQHPASFDDALALAGTYSVADDDRAGWVGELCRRVDAGGDARTEAARMGASWVGRARQRVVLDQAVARSHASVRELMREGADRIADKINDEHVVHATAVHDTGDTGGQRLLAVTSAAVYLAEHRRRRRRRWRGLREEHATGADRFPLAEVRRIDATSAHTPAGHAVQTIVIADEQRAWALATSEAEGLTLVNVLRRLIARHHDSAPAPEEPSAAPEAGHPIAVRLAQLERQRLAGTITDADFATAKANLRS